MGYESFQNLLNTRDAQAYLSLRWSHMSFCWFCHEVAQFMSALRNWISINAKLSFSLNFYWQICVQYNDIFYLRDIKNMGPENFVQYTFDGELDQIYNGVPDWVYEGKFHFFWQSLNVNVMGLVQENRRFVSPACHPLHLITRTSFCKTLCREHMLAPKIGICNLHLVIQSVHFLRLSRP